MNFGYPFKRFQLPDNGHAVDIGDGTALSFTIPHPLNTKEVIIEIYRNSTGKKVIADVLPVDSNNVTVSFARAPSLNQFKVLILRK